LQVKNTIGDFYIIHVIIVSFIFFITWILICFHVKSFENDASNLVLNLNMYSRKKKSYYVVVIAFRNLYVNSFSV